MKIENCQVAKRLLEELSDIEFAEENISQDSEIQSQLTFFTKDGAIVQVPIDKEFSEKAMELMKAYKEWVTKRLEKL